MPGESYAVSAGSNFGTEEACFRARLRSGGRHRFGLIVGMGLNPVHGAFRGDLAQAARTPGCAATRAGCASRAATEPDATKPASAAASAAGTTSASTTTSTAAATTAAATTAAAATTTAPARHLQAAADVFPVEDIKRGETDVGHFLFAQDEALIG